MMICAEDFGYECWGLGALSVRREPGRYVCWGASGPHLVNAAGRRHCGICARHARRLAELEEWGREEIEHAWRRRLE